MKKKGLGRNAVFGDDFSLDNITATTEIDREYVHQLPISAIDVNKQQPRKTFNQDSIEALAASIKANGMLQPITVQKKGERYEIIAGERRYRACRFLKMETVPAIIKELSPRQVCELALIENLQREDLNPIEAALAIDALMKEYELTQQLLAPYPDRTCTTSNQEESLEFVGDFPTMYVHLLPPYEEGRDLTNETVNGINCTFELVVYSDKSEKECRNIITAGIQQMKNFCGMMILLKFMNLILIKLKRGSLNLRE